MDTTEKIIEQKTEDYLKNFKDINNFVKKYCWSGMTLQDITNILLENKNELITNLK